MSESTMHCSFCGKSQHEVRKLIAGPEVFICDECVAICNKILRVAANLLTNRFTRVCVPKIRFGNIGGEGHRELGVT